MVCTVVFRHCGDAIDTIDAAAGDQDAAAGNIKRAAVATITETAATTDAAAAASAAAVTAFRIDCAAADGNSPAITFEATATADSTAAAAF